MATGGPMHSKLSDCIEEDRGASDVRVLFGVLSSETEGLDAHRLLRQLLAQLLELLDMVHWGQQELEVVVFSDGMVLLVADEFSHLGPGVLHDEPRPFPKSCKTVAFCGQMWRGLGRTQLCPLSTPAGLNLFHV